MTGDPFEVFAAGRTYEEIEEQEVADDRDAVTPVTGVTPSQAAILGLRKKLKWTQREMANWLGVSVISVCRWETVRPPKGLSLMKLIGLARSVKAAEEEAVFEEALATVRVPRLEVEYRVQGGGEKKMVTVAWVRLRAVTGARLAFNLKEISVVQEGPEGGDPGCYIETTGASGEEPWEVREDFDEVMTLMGVAEGDQLEDVERRGVERLVKHQQKSVERL
jgi:DNA-binding transcriptional regulator YiaG